MQSPFLQLARLLCSMIRLNRHRFADATLVMRLGSAYGTTEFGITGQFVQQPWTGNGTYFRVFA